MARHSSSRIVVRLAPRAIISTFAFLRPGRTPPACGPRCPYSCHTIGRRCPARLGPAPRETGTTDTLRRSAAFLARIYRREETSPCLHQPPEIVGMDRHLPPPAERRFEREARIVEPPLVEEFGRTV